MAKRIMITDDALFMRVTLKNILTQNGLEVVAEASNGREAVELYEQTNPTWCLWTSRCPKWTVWRRSKPSAPKTRTQRS